VEIARNWNPTPEQVAAHFQRAEEAGRQFAEQQEKIHRDANDPAFLNLTYTI
jgi:hypothetical protein